MSTDKSQAIIQKGKVRFDRFLWHTGCLFLPPIRRRAGSGGRPGDRDGHIDLVIRHLSRPLPSITTQEETGLPIGDTRRTSV